MTPGIDPPVAGEHLHIFSYLIRLFISIGTFNNVDDSATDDRPVQTHSGGRLNVFALRYSESYHKRQVCASAHLPHEVASPGGRSVRAPVTPATLTQYKNPDASAATFAMRSAPDVGAKR